MRRRQRRRPADGRAGCRAVRLSVGPYGQLLQCLQQPGSSAPRPTGSTSPGSSSSSTNAMSSVRATMLQPGPSTRSVREPSPAGADRIRPTGGGVRTYSSAASSARRTPLWRPGREAEAEAAAGLSAAASASASGFPVSGSAVAASCPAVGSPNCSRHTRHCRAISSAPSRRCAGPQAAVSGGDSAGRPPSSSVGSCGAGTPGAVTATGSGQPGSAATTYRSSGDRSYSRPQSQAASAHATRAVSLTATVHRAPAPSCPKTSP